jgi:2-polyprenyl-6-methoxyphenol hydroxylase-like FAD-dependent oxidoreductase
MLAALMRSPVLKSERFGGESAVVLGGSMAGLLAARVLADHFDQVSVIERDALPDNAEPRKGVPQGRHLHGLLKRGEEIFSDLFPGILEELVKGGAVRLDFGRDLYWYHFGAFKLRIDSGIMTTCVSRPFLEAEVRRRVFSLPNVRRLDERDGVGFVMSRDGRPRIAGIRTRRRDGNDAMEDVLGDLVVDASGRGSHTPKWLESIGVQKPEESAVKVSVKYATRIYRRPDPWPFPWKSLFVIGTPPESKRLGVMVPIEGGRCIGLLAGMLGDHPPDDPDGFLQFAKSLPVDDFYRAVAACEPLTDVATYSFTSNLRRHYEKLSRFPEGLVIVGDSLCSFNPVYGQGMSTAGREALTIDEHLRAAGRAGERDVSASIQRKLAKIIDVPWKMTTLEDLRYPEVIGERPPGYLLLDHFMRRVHRVCARDPEVLLHFLRGMHMLESPAELFRPRMLLRILRG